MLWSNPLFLDIIEDEWKDVGMASARFGEKVLTITVTNAYPCYSVGIPAGIHYQGSVPAHVKEIIITAPPELDVWIEPLEGSPPLDEVQLHYLEEYFMYIWVHVIEIDDPDTGEPIIDPMQDTEYTFTIEIVLCQYNDPSQL
jgi:hypothetical protein